MSGKVKGLGIVVVGVVGVSVFAGGVWAELTPGGKRAAEVLIGQFSHRGFAVREAAVRKLVELGPDVVPLVRKTLAATDDNEIKLRCELTLKGIAKKYGVDVGLGGKPPAKDWGFAASKVTLKMRDADLEEIVRTLGEQSGNRLVRPPPRWAGKPITLGVTDMPYWQALDALCARAGLSYTADGRTGALQLVAAPASRQVSAYAGPVVVKLESATLSRDFRTSVGRLDCRFRFFYEDRLGPVLPEAWVTAAEGPDGTPLRLVPVRAGAVLWGTRAARLAPTEQIGVGIQGVPWKLKKVAKLEGRIRLTIGEGNKTLEIKDVLAGGKKSATLGGGTLNLTGVHQGGTWYTVSVRLTVHGEEVPVPVYRGRSAYGLALVDPNGTRREGRAWGTPVFRRPRGRVGAGIAGERRAVPIAPTRFLVRRQPDVAGPWMLVYTMPAKTTEKEFPFTFKDLPLP